MLFFNFKDAISVYKFQAKTTNFNNKYIIKKQVAYHRANSVETPHRMLPTTSSSYSARKTVLQLARRRDGS